MSKVHVIRGFKPVYWSVVGASALAETEVEYQDKTSFAIDVGFSVTDEGAFNERLGVGDKGRATVVIWTTTPWTLPANQAVCLHPELEYVLVECKKDMAESACCLPMCCTKPAWNVTGMRAVKP